MIPLALSSQVSFSLLMVLHLSTSTTHNVFQVQSEKPYRPLYPPCTFAHAAEEN